MNASFSISDLFAFVVALCGMVLSLASILDQYFSPARSDPDPAVRGSVTTWLARPREGDGPDTNGRIDILLRDYETANREVERRDSITLIVGTILVGSSFLILGNAAGARTLQPIGVNALASIGLFTIWLLLLHGTAKRLNYLAFARMRSIELALTQFLAGETGEGEDLIYRFGIHSYFDESTGNQTAKWLRLRRTFWAMVLLFLSLSWLFLSIATSITL